MKLFSIPNAKALVNASLRRFDPEMVVSYTCDVGFSLAAGSTDHVTCKFNGGWSKLRPVCERVECGQPPLVDNGMVEVEVIMTKLSVPK